MAEVDRGLRREGARQSKSSRNNLEFLDRRPAEHAEQQEIAEPREQADDDDVPF